MALTALSTLLDRMDAYQTIANVETVYKVRFLDEALRAIRRETQFPWMLKKTSLRVFEDVLEYPVASDHDELAYLDNNKEYYGARARFRYTSLPEFYEDPNNRNDLAEIWESGTKYLGVRYSPSKAGSTKLNSAETASDWTASGTASSPTLDEVIYKKGSGSIRFSVTAGTATMVNTITAVTDSNYLRKYHFKWIYLDAAPTSITLRLRVDASNLLSTTVTTQYSGQAFAADAWNLVGHDLNAATVTGTIGTSPTFTSESFSLNGAAAGTYYVDESHLRSWENLDYFYYSIFNVALVGQTVGNQEYFFNSSGVFSTDSQLVGDTEWTDVILYDAILTGMADKENKSLVFFIAEKRRIAWDALFEQYPSLRPIIITSKYNFIDDHQRAMSDSDISETEKW